ncbi:PIG-L deacetylase family protein [Kozakia baliensis]|uniref:PIG-L deacetylase family protein n=1 Tax=Kozakia baliensis TaxID=153496 RepID=UPI00068F4BB1|nr:PIG-L deacetylase family protein [Kozakia baliensis]
MISAAALHTAWENLPLADLNDIAPGRTLVLAPHPDDESLGCAGFIAESCARGILPIVVIATDGAASHPQSKNWPPERLVRQRRQEAQNALTKLGLPTENLFFLNLPDSHAPVSGPDFEKSVDTLIDLAKEHRCATFLTTSRHDPHCDHEAAWLMASEAAKRLSRTLLTYPVWSWTLPPETQLDDTMPSGWRLSIETHLSTKQAAITAHESQYGRLIDDDPSGFVLPENLLSRVVRPYEVFIAS